MRIQKGKSVGLCQSLLLAALLASCGGSLSREIGSTRHIPASSGAPEVVRVVDLGAMSSIPSAGFVPTLGSDGVFVVGELVLVEGYDFGKLPTLSIGGKPAERLARTKSGGILTRIPVEVDAGTVRVDVSHSDGLHGLKIRVERHLALADSKNVHLVSVEPDGSMEEKKSLSLGGAVDLDFGHEGQALYVLGKDTLSIVVMAAKGGPAIGQRVGFHHRAPRALVSRIGVPVLALLHGAGITFFDTRQPTAISETGRILLPSGAAAAVLSPDGKYLAVISLRGNGLSLIQLGADPVVVSRLELMGGDTVSLLEDLVFSPSGDEIWILSGNNSRSVSAGVRPTQLSVVDVVGGSLTYARAATIGVAQAPRNLAVSHRRAIMAAAAVRSTRQRAALVLSSVSTSFVRDGSKSQDRQGKLLRVDLDGNTTELGAGNSVYSQMRLSHDQRRVFAATRQAGVGEHGVGITSASLTGGAPYYLPLGENAETDPLHSLPLAIAP